MKKNHALLFLAIVMFLQAYTQTTVIATWMAGTQYEPALYGTKGASSPFNRPGIRSSAVSWIDATGNFWLFGGYGHSTITNNYPLNDLWKYDPLRNEWTWMSGNNIPNQRGIYGSRGISSARNQPGSRYSAISWTDAAGNLWLFGGWGYASNAEGYLNDLWKYNTATNEWTWMSGDNTVNQQSIYGTKGIPTSFNMPGSRSGSPSWTDAAGNLWMMGGYGYASSGSYGYLNDLWKYNPATNKWIWMSGNNTAFHPGVYGTKGIAFPTNQPGARAYGANWTDSIGNFWLMGGYGYGSNSVGYLNDLWKYNSSTNEWTWVNGDNTVNQTGNYGTIGIASSSNKPGARRSAISWKDGFGNLWLFGGDGYASNSLGTTNDLWKYDPRANLWTWMSGDISANQGGIYGIQGDADLANKPGARYGAVSWIDNQGSFWLFGGRGYVSENPSHSLNDLWKYAVPGNQTYVLYRDWDEDGFGNLNESIQIQVSIIPKGYVKDNTDCDDSRMLYADKDGDGHGAGAAVSCGVPNSGDCNDSDAALVVCHPVDFKIIATWTSGDSIQNQTGVYGVKGVFSLENKPGRRRSAGRWIDAAGNLWLFGSIDKSDLWKYDPAIAEWTWISGDSTAYQPAVYGTKGVASVFNNPGARESAISWTDKKGNFWLFGGLRHLNNKTSALNDLWRYDPATNEWTWMSGDKIADQLGVYGTRGIPSALNQPMSRHDAVGWTDANGNFWMYGGRSYANPYISGFLNDLWKYNPATGEWTWMNGSSLPNQLGIYGTKGIAFSGNKPGARVSAAGWTDKKGHLWLFGGYNNVNFYKDLWKYDPAANQWTWMSGDRNTTIPSIYGTKGVPSTNKWPGGRLNAVSWTDVSGKLWLFGGYGYADKSTFGYLNDLWNYNPDNNTWTWVFGDDIPNQPGIYGIKGVPSPDNKPGARQDAASWADASGNFWFFGGFGYATTTNGSLSDLWRFTLESTAPTLTMAALSVSSACAGSELRVNYTTSGSFGAGNVFTVQLSDATGSFTSPVNIGSVDATASGSLAVTIPANTPSGTAYRIRVVASSPAAVGTDNGTDLTITSPPRLVIHPPAPRCAPATVELTAAAITQGSHLPEGTLLQYYAAENPGEPLADPAHVPTGTYLIKALNGSCADQGDVQVVIHTPPAPPHITSDGAIPLCPGASLQLTASTATAYRWSTGETTASIRVSQAGNYTVSITDENGCSSTSAVFSLQVLDNTPPQISDAVASPSVLWPANHKLLPVTLAYTTTDNCGAVSTKVAVSSNSAGANPADWKILDERHLLLRAERSGNSGDRVYTLTLTAQDESGNVSTEQLLVTVPHDRSPVKTETQSSSVNATFEKENTTLQVKVLPNPSNSHFTLQINSSRKENLRLRVMDILGRQVEERNGLAPNRTLTPGQQYRPGVYYAEVVQGKEKQTLKLVKGAGF